MHRTAYFVIIGALLFAGARDAAAQNTTPTTPAGQASPSAGQTLQRWLLRPWTDRGYFNFNVGFESTSGTLNDAATFSLHDESGTKTVEQNVDSGSIIDFSVGSRVWRNVSAGLGYHRGSNHSEAAATASVPHPVLFNANRVATVTASELDRVEQAIHLQVGYMIPVSEEISVHVTAGPSFFRLRQEVLADVMFAETSFPFTSVNTAAVVEERSDAVTGLNIGVDVGYKLYETDAYRIGGGMFIRYAGASARINVFQSSIDTDVGGLQIGFGARVRF